MRADLDGSEQMAVNILGVDRRVVALAVALLSVGCSDGDNPPTSATVLIEASASVSQPLMLLVSTSFDILSTGDFLYNNLDSITITGDYTELYVLNPEARFTAKLLNDQGTEESVRLGILIDDVPKYDRTAVLGQGGFLQYVYRFDFVVAF